MIDIATLKSAIKFDKLDAIAFITALVGVLMFGLNTGLVMGLFASFAGLIWRSSHPHMAIVGQVGDTGHFRNVKRHQVSEYETLLIVRIDESLFYGNVYSVQSFIENELANRPQCQHVVLMLSAVNHIDLTAQDMLIKLCQHLKAKNITLHYSEVKGPVMDIIEQTDVIQGLTGQVFLSTQQAVKTLGCAPHSLHKP